MVLGGSCERAAGGAAVDQLGYRPNRAARSLATQHTDMVALIVPEPDARLFLDLFFSVIVNAVNREFEDTHLQLVLMLADRGCEDTKLRPFLYEGHVDGTIVTLHHQVPHQIQTLLNAPMVFIGRPTQAPTFNSWVDVDNTESGRLGARRLIERGSRRPAIFTGPLDMLAARDKLNGYTEVMESFKLPVQAIEGGFTSASGAECAARMSPDIVSGLIGGVYASSDLMAIGAINR
ncbi:LacI family DNA-binding transcriptional regulator [Propionimicrobium lymphophilum]|uniref:LacI family DNA-binding transcriptional regulator n=1 Tax=Propionimicrobium lymphophilum TaxID=33012 RepID=UPI002889C9EA|nr:LacI family DNA-binding transcriptional regulator [Propionimicrobium lymphophilum]